MKQKRYGTLGGLTVPVMIYDSPAEADKAAGKTNVLLDIANDNLHYRGGPAAATREFICELVEQKFGVPPKTKATDKKVKDANGKEVPVMEWDESEGEYIRRVMSMKKLEDLKTLQADVDAWAAAAYSDRNDKGEIVGEKIPLAVDAKEPERKPKKAPTLSQEDKDLALEFITGKKSLTKLADKCKAFGIEVPKLTKDNAKDQEAIGWVVRAYFAAERKAAQERAKSAF